MDQWFHVKPLKARGILEFVNHVIIQVTACFLIDKRSLITLHDLFQESCRIADQENILFCSIFINIFRKVRKDTQHVNISQYSISSPVAGVFLFIYPYHPFQDGIQFLICFFQDIPFHGILRYPFVTVMQAGQDCVCRFGFLPLRNTPEKICNASVLVIEIFCLQSIV